MIMEMLGEQQIGIYAAAVKLSEAFYFLPALLTVSFFPAIVNAKKSSEKLYMQRLQNLYSLLIWLALPIAMLFTLIGQSVVVFLYGNEYEEAGEVLIVHIWSAIFVFISAGFGRYLMAENLAIINMNRVVIGAFINVVLNYFLIPQYGVIGAAYATLITLVLINYVFDIFNKKLWGQLSMKLIAFYYPLQLIYKFFYERSK